MRIFYKQKMLSGHTEFIHLYSTGPDSFFFIRGIPGDQERIISFPIESDTHESAKLKLSRLTESLEQNNCERINYEDLDDVFLKILYPESVEENENNDFFTLFKLRNEFMDKFEGEISQRLLGFNYASDMGNEGANMLYSCFDAEEFTHYAKELLAKETDINNCIIAIKGAKKEEWQVVFPESYDQEFNIL